MKTKKEVITKQIKTIVICDVCKAVGEYPILNNCVWCGRDIHVNYCSRPTVRTKNPDYEDLVCNFCSPHYSMFEKELENLYSKFEKDKENLEKSWLTVALGKVGNFNEE